MIQEIFTELSRNKKVRSKFKPHKGHYVVVHSSFNGMQEFIMNNKKDLSLFFVMIRKGSLMLNVDNTFVFVNNKTKYTFKDFCLKYKNNI